MDYKELIEELRFLSGHVPEQMCDSDGKDPLEKAADALEMLLEERDALMQDAIRCDTCIHVKECFFNELRRNDCVQSNRGHWKWRGLRKRE